MSEDTGPWEPPRLEDRLQAVAQQRVVQTPKRRNPIPYAVGGVLALFGVAAIAISVGTAGSKADAVRPPVTTTHHDSPDPTPTPEQGSSGAFAVALQDAEPTLMADIEARLDDELDAVNERDPALVSNIAGDVAGLFDQMRDTAVGLPGADSAVGRTTIHAAEVCADAQHYEHEIFDRGVPSSDEFDTASSKLDDCASANQEAIDAAQEAIDANTEAANLN